MVSTTGHAAKGDILSHSQDNSIPVHGIRLMTFPDYACLAGKVNAQARMPSFMTTRQTPSVQNHRYPQSPSMHGQRVGAA
ncbi:MAG: hypothetical protein ABF990_14115 [Acetobacter sp.]|uniref:hypothetical protein n=1 Tax=Acetobacter sp. TaxID=440 RepID=UPI0039EB65FB